MGDAPLILACDTTQGACSVAVYRNGILAQDLSAMGKGHAEALLPMMQNVLAAAHIEPAQIDRLAVTHGPGTFTGVRVGLAAMRGLALALDIPLKTFGTLDVMARGSAFSGPLIVAVDARRETFYAQSFTPDKTPIGVPQALSAEAVLALYADKEATLKDATPYDAPVGLMGSGAALVLSADSTLNATKPTAFQLLDAPHWPHASILAQMAADMADTDWQDLPVAVPLYLRPPDASLPNRDKFPAHAKKPPHAKKPHDATS